MRPTTALIALALCAATVIAQPPAGKTPPAPGGVDEHGFPLVPSDPSPKKDAKGKKPARETYGPKLDPLVKAMRSARDSDKIKAIQTMAALGKEAAPAARPLCDAAADGAAAVRNAAVEALETVRPDLHGPVLMLVIDQNDTNRIMAVKKLGEMGAEAKPTMGLLLRRLLQIRTTRPVVTTVADGAATTFEAVRQIGAEDPEVLAFFASHAMPNPQPQFDRLDAIAYLIEYAGEDEARRKSVAKYVVAGIDGSRCQSLCVSTAGDYGAICKEALPALKQLKFSTDGPTRDAAIAAIAKISGQ